MNYDIRRLKILSYKISGIYDEINILENRFTFLSDIYFPYIPNVQLFDKSSYKSNPFRLLREQSAKQKTDLESHIMKGTISKEDWDSINSRFYEISVLQNIMKMSFYIRTISLEMPQVEIGHHRGLERTTGNEGFLRSADIITERLVQCIRTSFKWDGIFTYTGRLDEDLWGGGIRFFKLFKTYHISLSDETKYFSGGHFFIAHEIAHLLLTRTDYDSIPWRSIGPEESIWFVYLVGNLVTIIENYLKESKCSHKKETQIKENGFSCPVKYLLEYRFIKKGDFIIEECFADIFAVIIIGSEYLVSFLDFIHFYNVDIYFRLKFVLIFLKLEGYLKEEIIKERYNYFNSLQSKYRIFENDFLGKCRTCLNNVISKLIQRSIIINHYFINYIKNDPFVYLSSMETYYNFDPKFQSDIREIKEKIKLVDSLKNIDKTKQIKKEDKQKIIDISLEQYELERKEIIQEIQDKLIKTGKIEISDKKLIINAILEQLKITYKELVIDIQEKLVRSLNIGKNLNQLEGKLFDNFFNKDCLYKEIEEEPDYIKELKCKTPVYGKDPLILLNLYHKNFMKNKNLEKIDYYTFLYSLFHAKTLKREKNKNG